jgi:hypothetical protein
VRIITLIGFWVLLLGAGVSLQAQRWYIPSEWYMEDAEALYDRVNADYKEILNAYEDLSLVSQQVNKWLTERPHSYLSKVGAKELEDLYGNRLIEYKLTALIKFLRAVEDSLAKGRLPRDIRWEGATALGGVGSWRGIRSSHDYFWPRRGDWFFYYDYDPAYWFSANEPVRITLETYLERVKTAQDALDQMYGVLKKKLGVDLSQHSKDLMDKLSNLGAKLSQTKHVLEDMKNMLENSKSGKPIASDIAEFLGVGTVQQPVTEAPVTCPIQFTPEIEL